MEKIINKIQSLEGLNALKDAIMKTGNLNITVSFALIFYSMALNVITVSLKTRAYSAILYTAFIILVSFLIVYYTFDKMHETSKHVDPMIGCLSILIINSAALINGNIVSLPLLMFVQAILMAYFMKGVGRIKIDMPYAPPAVESSLNGLFVPVLSIALSLIVGVFAGDILTVLANGIVTLTAFMGSYVMIILVILTICTIWIKGLHGVATVATIMRPFWFYMMLINGYMIVLGQRPLYIGSESFMQWTVWIGGSGCTLGLTLALRYFTKSNYLQQLGKTSMKTNLFNINEDIIFGVPIAENKQFRVPFFAAPIICATLAFLAMHFNLVNIPSVVMPWVSPAPIGIFFATLMDWRSLILLLILVMVSFVTYYPFLKAYDQRLFAEERDNA